MVDKIIQPQQSKEVTDPVMLRELARQRTNKNDVEFHRDYVARSPYTKLYRNKKNNTRYAVISGLPMVAPNGNKVAPRWRTIGEHKYVNTSNLFTANVSRTTTEVEILYDQPSGVLAGSKLSYSPTLSGTMFIEPKIQIMAIDPMNPDYLLNTIEWDYGSYKRRLREIEGRLQGYWVFESNPGADITIRYNQSGDFRLKLGKYAIDEDTEFIPASEFVGADFPLIIWDTLTVYPDADPESTTVDGQVGYEGGVQKVWADIIAETGNDVFDDIAENWIVQIRAHSTSNYWDRLVRGIFLFNTAALGSSASISAATLSIWGSDKSDTFSAISPVYNIYSSNPASNDGLVGADYSTLGSTAFCDTAITYANWDTTGYNDFVLNASGRAAISKTGVTKLGLRNSNYDVAAASPTWEVAKLVVIKCYSADQGGATKPKLVVTYTTPNVQGSIAPLILQGVI